MDENSRRARNAEKLAELFPTFRVRIAAVIASLEGQGIRPRIQEAWRSEQAQLEAFQSGHSKLMFGFHNVTGANATHEALAVDLLDDDNPRNPVAAEAQLQQLTTGIRWGLPKAMASAIDAALAARNWVAPVKVGWDPTHIQPLGLTVSEAKAGKRPH